MIKLPSEGLQIIGHRSYTRQDIRIASNLIAESKIKTFINSKYKLEDANRALLKVRETGLLGRVVVTNY